MSVTDEEVDAAIHAWWSYTGEGPEAQGRAMRAALEAAENIREAQ